MSPAYRPQLDTGSAESLLSGWLHPKARHLPTTVRDAELVDIPFCLFTHRIGIAPAMLALLRAERFDFALSMGNFYRAVA